MKTFKVNSSELSELSKYVHFAIRKDSGKIVNGWEQSEDIKYWSRIDLRDIFPDDKLSSFKVVGKKHLLSIGIDPMNWDNWEKTILVEAYNPDYTRVSGKMYLMKYDTEVNGCLYAIANDRSKSFKCGRKQMEGLVEELRGKYPTNDIFKNLVIEDIKN